MVGNDIVDLSDSDALPETRHPRFDTRVFSAAERAAIESSAASNAERWRLWAAKEAAYKLIRKRAPTTVFSPLGFHVELDARASEAACSGVVEHEGTEVSVRFDQNESWVHAVASDEAGESRVISRVAELPGTALDASDPDAPSAAVRSLVCRTLAEPLGVAPETLEVRRSGRVPHLYWGGEPAPADLSLSHHGRYVAFACALVARAPSAQAANGRPSEATASLGALR